MSHSHYWLPWNCSWRGCVSKTTSSSICLKDIVSSGVKLLKQWAGSTAICLKGHQIQTFSTWKTIYPIERPHRHKNSISHDNKAAIAIMGFEFENIYTPGQQIPRRCIEQIGCWWRSVWQRSKVLHNQQQLFRSDWLDEASRNQNRNWNRETLSGHNERIGDRESETVFGNGERIQTTERCNDRIHRYHLQSCQYVHILGFCKSKWVTSWKICNASIRSVSMVYCWPTGIT